MRRAIHLLVLGLIVLTCGGLFSSAAAKVREAEARMQCVNNLKLLGLALHSYHDSTRLFPTGTVGNQDSPPDRRLSWLTEIFPSFMSGGYKVDLDRSKPWDDPANCPPRWWHRVDDTLNIVEGEEELWRHLTCPSNSVTVNASLPLPTHYLGLAGVGESAAELPLTDRRAGFFGYDRKLTKVDVKDGQGTTIAVFESADGGPWTAGGRATVRGLIRDGRPVEGPKGQFSNHHYPGCNPYALFADGSVRVIGGMSIELLEALATVAGGEEVPD